MPQCHAFTLIQLSQKRRHYLKPFGSDNILNICIQRCALVCVCVCARMGVPMCEQARLTWRSWRMTRCFAEPPGSASSTRNMEFASLLCVPMPTYATMCLQCIDKSWRPDLACSNDSALQRSGTTTCLNLCTSLEAYGSICHTWNIGVLCTNSQTTWALCISCIVLLRGPSMLGQREGFLLSCHHNECQWVLWSTSSWRVPKLLTCVWVYASMPLPL